MKTPLSWISLYTPLADIEKKYSLTELAHLYSIHTAEIDDIIPHTLDKIVIARVLSTEKHPESKKLSIVRVDLGIHGEETILTGAENIVNAHYVAVAMIGAVLGGDFVIAERPMAGMMSRGMICSADELGLVAERATGILVLEEIWDANLLESKIGTDFFDLTLPFPGIGGTKWNFPLRDTTFEIDNKFITNRPDLFSIMGNAREWHAVFDAETFLQKNPGIDPILVSDHEIRAEIETDRCLAYTLLEMRNISVKNSPFGVSVMMHRAGLAAKYDLVDITNLMMIEYGQPMHVFDRDKVVGNIRVRLARAGESILALNGKTYELTNEDIVIADDRAPIAIAGVIGGMESAVSETTTSIVWESGTFDPTSVRLTAQRLGLRTDASTRYEKSIDPVLAGQTLPRVLEYLTFFGKNIDIVGQFSYINTKKLHHTTITLPYRLVDSKAGIMISRDQIRDILMRLSFEILSHDDDTITVIVPSWRATKDVSIAEDLVEEVLRIYGYEQIPLIPLSGSFTVTRDDAARQLSTSLLHFFANRAWNEVYNYSFTNAETESKLLKNNLGNYIRVVNPYSEELTHLRTTLAHGLLENIRDNIRHNSELSFFEIGKIAGKNISHEHAIEALIVSQDSRPYGERRHIAGISTRYDMRSFRREIELLFRDTIGYIPILEQRIPEDVPFLHPGLAGTYQVNDRTIGIFGKIHPSVGEYFEVPENTWYFEIDFETLLDLHTDREELFQKISAYQSIPRELNFILDESVETGTIARDIAALHPWIDQVYVDSIYRDEGKIGIGKKSVNFSFILQSMDTTITDEEAQKVQNLIIESLEKKGYPLRAI